MKIHYKQSIRQQLDELFGKGLTQDIDSVELTESEYIQLLEELPTLGQILLTDADTKFRVYKGIRLKVLR
jgi:hypothetical protein